MFWQLAQHKFDLTSPIEDDLGSRFGTSGESIVSDNATSWWTSIPSRQISLALQSSGFYDSDFLTTKSLQPVVVTTCSPNSLSHGFDPSTTYLTIGDGIQNGLKDLISFARFKKMAKSQKLPYGSTNDNETFYYDYLWQQAPDSVSNSSLICIDEPSNNTNEQYLHACTVGAYWARASINYTIAQRSFISKFDGDKKPEAIGGPISISVDWVEKLTQE